MMFNSWRLDLLLGARMLAKYPVLTLVGGFGIAVAVAIGAGAFSVIYGNFLASTLPLHEGDRLVSIEVWDQAANRPERRVQNDFQIWRKELQFTHDVSAFRTLTPNLIAPGGQPVSVRVAAITAAGFTAARVRPLLGRYLTDADEAQGAPAVLVIGERVWRNRFAGDRAILGRTVQLGAAPHAVVGVMPETFAFPVNHHFWVSLRDEPSAGLREGPDLMVFGRLAPGVTRETAQAEIETVSRRAWRESPARYAQLRPMVLPYSHPFLGLHKAEDISGLQTIQAFMNSLLVVICLNIALLVYARTAMRQPEIALRTALGASRARIVGQLFLEAAVLCGAATLVGVGFAAAGMRYVETVVPIADELPYWLNFRLSPGAVLYAGFLSVAAAAIIGVLPALRVTGRNLRGGLMLGKSWTAMVGAQVAVAVALLPGGLVNAWGAIRAGIANPEFPAAEYLSAELHSLNDDPIGERFSLRLEELRRRLTANAKVSGVSFAAAIPGDEPAALFETDFESTLRRVRVNHVDAAFWSAFDVRLLAGRLPRDQDSGDGPIVVNRALAQDLFGGNALGRRIRAANGGGQWREIVGIVADFPPGVGKGMGDSPLRIYQAARLGQLRPAALMVRVRRDTPAGLAPALRDMVASVDPELQVRNLLSLEDALRRDQWIRRLEGAVLVVTSLSVLLLAAAGIYAMISLTMTQRRKEIGIRIAVGGNGWRVAGAVFSRALTPLAVGSLLGLAAGAALESMSDGNLLRGNGFVVLPAVALLVVAAGCLAGVGPLRAGLRVQPTEVIRGS